MFDVAGTAQGAFNVYVIVCVPAPAMDGENCPDAGFMMPVPLQVPPGEFTFNKTALSFKQNGPACVMIGATLGFIASVVEAVPEHPANVTVTV